MYESRARPQKKPEEYPRYFEDFFEDESRERTRPGGETIDLFPGGSLAPTYPENDTPTMAITTIAMPRVAAAKLSAPNR